MPVQTVSPAVAPKAPKKTTPAPKPKTPASSPTEPTDSSKVSEEAREEERRQILKETQGKIREMMEQTVWTKPRTGEELYQKFRSQSVRRFLGQ